MATTRNYFQKFPAISYNDYVVRDISVRTKLLQHIQETGLALLPYTIKEGERPDNIASFYYNDPFYSWTIYLVNGMIDPYDDWPKDSKTLNDYIEKKYGGMEQAMDVVLRYEVDWASDTTLLSPSQYEALPAENKKYWDVQFGYDRQPINYYRKNLDWSIDNNRLDQVVVVSNSTTNSLANSFEVGERTYQYNYLNDVAVKSTVISVDSTTDSNTILVTYSNSTVYDINFSSSSSIAFLRSTKNILPRANVSGTSIQSGTYVKHVIDGNYIQLSKTPTGIPSSSNPYTFTNPASAILTVQKVDFSDVTFSSNNTLATPNSFFTHEYGDSTPGTFTSNSTVVSNVKTSLFVSGQKIEVLSGTTTFTRTVSSISNSTHMVISSNSTITGSATIYYGAGIAYHDEGNYLVGRKNDAKVIVLSHERLDTNSESMALLSNSHLSVNELVYWKPVTAYDEEINRNEAKKEILVLDAGVVNELDNNLEAILKNV